MGWVSVLIAVVAAGWHYRNENSVLAGLAAAAAVVGLWSYGVMHNYAVQARAKRGGYTGRFYDLDPTNADAVPDWLALVNMAAAAGGVTLLVIAVWQSS